MAANSPYDTAVAAVSGLTNSWFFRDLSGTTITATAGGVNGTLTGTTTIAGTTVQNVGLQVVSPLARDLSTPLSTPYADVVAGIHLGAATGPSTPILGAVTFGNNFNFTGTTAFSCAVFVRLRADQPTSYTPVEMEIVDKTPTASRNGWDIAVTTARQIIFRRWVAGAAESVTSSTVLTPQTWYFICATYDGAGAIKLYVDDGAVATGTSVGSLPGNVVNFTVGAQNGGSTGGLDADVGPLSLYNRALTQSEALALFNAAFVVAPAVAHTYYVHPSGSDVAAGTIGAPWQTFFHAASTVQAGDTVIFQYASGAPYVETTTRAYSTMAYAGTKRAGISFISDQPYPYTLKPVIQFGTLSTGTAVGTTSSIVGNGVTATYTVANSLTNNSYVSVTGATNAGFNVTDARVLSATGSLFTIANPTNATASVQGVVTTGIDLTNAQKVYILQQCYHTITGLYFTQPLMGSDYNDRLVAFFGQQYGTLQPEIQRITSTAAGSGTWTLGVAGHANITGIASAVTASALQTLLRASLSTNASGFGDLDNIACTGGPLGTAPIVCTWSADQAHPYAVGPMTLMTVVGQPTGATVSVDRTGGAVGGNGTRWYQSSDFCTMQYCRITNAYQPYKSAIDTASTFQFNIVEGCNVAIGCYNSNAPRFSNNTFLMNGTGQALRNGGNLGQADCIQSKGGTRNAQIYSNVIRVPVGATQMTGVGIYVGGGSNDMNGEYDNSSAGKEGYNNVCYNNVVIGEYPAAIGYAGIAISGGVNDVVVNNLVVNALVSFRITYGGLWPTTNARATTDTPTILNNIWYQTSATGGGYAFKWGNIQSTDLGTTPLTYSNNLRYQMQFSDDVVTSVPPNVVANDLGANIVDPQFANWLSDWHTDPGSIVSRAGTLTTRTAFGQGYLRGANLSMSNDYAGATRSATPDVGIYAFSNAGEIDVGAGPSFLSGVDTINVGPGSVGSGTEALRQILVVGDPAWQGQMQRVGANGQALVTPYAFGDSLVQGNPAAINDTSPHPLLPAAGVNFRNYMTDLVVVNSHATLGTLITISDSGGTIWQGYAAAAGGGVALAFPAPRRQPTTNAVVNVTCGTAATVYISVGGFKAL